MSTEPLSYRIVDSTDLASFPLNATGETTDHHQSQQTRSGASREFAGAEEEEVLLWLRRYLAWPADFGSFPSWRELSPWSRSAAKRLFDCACVVVSLPILVPLMLVIGAAVRLTSRGPVLFLQGRVGQNGRTFTILKFRTLVHVDGASHPPITTSDSQRFTPVGPFLRRWKLDELPQLINVLLGHMSLVGPRPKMPEHVICDPPCRPGITGLATIVFAGEERILSCVARERLDDYFYSVVLPTKRQLDAEYMAHATFLSDLRLVINSVLRQWDTAALDEFIAVTTCGKIEEVVPSGTSHAARTIVHSPVPLPANRQVEAEEVSTG